MHAVTLAPQDWMQSAPTRRLLAALTAGGAEVRFVGGCVRDALAGRPVSDIDLATTEQPNLVIERLEAADLHAVPTGVAHGTVTAIVDGQPFEVTTLRRDVETFGRHARVAFTDDWEADAARRDFTMNALSCRPDGTVFDFFGGIEDLHGGRVRFVGDARRRIAEDVLRLLRFFRFYAWYGRPPPDADGLAACTEAAPLLSNLSAERVRRELLRLLAAPDPMPALHAMSAAGVLGHLLPGPVHLDRMGALVELERSQGEAEPIRRVAALMGSPDAAAALARRWRFANAERKRLAAAVSWRGDAAGTAELGNDRARMRRALYRVGTERYRDLAFLDAAEHADGRGLLAARLREASRWTRPRLPVDGRDVVALGVGHGPDVGALLAALESWWLDHDFRPNRRACLERLHAILHGRDADPVM